MGTHRPLPALLAFSAIIGLATGGLAFAHASSPESSQTNGSAGATNSRDLCPSTLRLETFNGSDFLAVFQSRDSTVVDVSMRLYADNTDYVVSVPAVTLGTQYRDIYDRLTYRSQPINIHISGDTPIAAAVDATIRGTDEKCETEKVYIEPLGSAYKAKEVESRTESDASIDAEVDAMTMSTLARPVPSTKFPCDVPFRRPLLEQAREPKLPFGDFRKEAGVVFLSVWLDDASNVTKVTMLKSSGNAVIDDSARTAAQYSKFTTEVFGCKPLASRYIFRSTFAAEAER